MDFLVITYTPARQGPLGVIAPNVNLDTMTAEDENDLRNRLTVPLEGYCLIVDPANITTVTSEVVNKIAPVDVGAAIADEANQQT